MNEREDVMLLIGYIYGYGNHIPQPITDAMLRLTNPLIPIKPDKCISKMSLKEVMGYCKIEKNPAPAVICSKPEDNSEISPESSGSSNQSNPTPLESIPTGFGEHKRRKPWSEEARTAQAERLRARHAAKKQQVEDKIHQVEPINQQVTPVIRDNPNEYIGQRTDGALIDADYGDIKKMLSNGLPKIRVARSYGVTEERLSAFIDRHKAVEEHFSGKL